MRIFNPSQQTTETHSMKLSDIKRALDLHNIRSVMFAHDLYAVDQHTNGFKLVKTTGWNKSDLLNFLNY